MSLKYGSCIIWRIFTAKKILFIWNWNLTEHPRGFGFALFCFTESGNPIDLVVENRFQHVNSSRFHHLSRGMAPFFPSSSTFQKRASRNSTCLHGGFLFKGSLWLYLTSNCALAKCLTYSTCNCLIFNKNIFKVYCMWVAVSSEAFSFACLFLSTWPTLTQLT